MTNLLILGIGILILSVNKITNSHIKHLTGYVLISHSLESVAGL